MTSKKSFESKHVNKKIAVIRIIESQRNDTD